MSDEPGRILAVEDCLIYAYKSGSEVGVRTSVLVHDTHEVMQPVWAELAGKCFSVESFEMQDDTMMFGKSLNRSFMIHEHCPSAQHNCAVSPARRM